VKEIFYEANLIQTFLGTIEISLNEALDNAHAEEKTVINDV